MSEKWSRWKFLLCAEGMMDGWLTAACSRSSCCLWRNSKVDLQAKPTWWGRNGFSFFIPSFQHFFKAAGPGSIDRHGQLCSQILKVRLYEVPCPIQACVLGINRFFAYCHKKKLIQRFPLPQVFITPSVTVHCELGKHLWKEISKMFRISNSILFCSLTL